MKTKLMLAAAAIVATATMVSAHLPSMYDARFGIDKERMRQTGLMNQGKRIRATFQSPAAWDPTATYSGDYTTYSGDTVIHGEYNGQPLYWWAKFWSKDDEPGTLGANGGTSPWVMINSLSQGKAYTWQGYTGSAPGGPVIATWRNGAEGAYSFTHDDIGSMPLSKAIKPAYELAQEAEFTDIKQAWGVFVREMGEDEWNAAIAMVKDGHEMFNHSMDHTSAADQYQWFYNKDTIPDFDPSIPYAIRGLTVKSLWGDPTGPAPWDNPAPTYLTDSGQKIGDCDPAYAGDPIRVLTLEDNNIKISGPAYWTGYSFSTDVCIQGKVSFTITPKGNTKTVTLPSGMKVYVVYDAGGEADISGLPEDGSGEATNRGIIYAVSPAWLDGAQLDKYGENGWSGSTTYPSSVGGSVATDQGAPGLIASIFAVKAWEPNDFVRNMKDANDTINKYIYEKIETPGKHFVKGKRSEYFGYPFDAYSLETHAKLESYQIYQARGGSKTPQVMKGDFFHPYSIDFDAFYITKQDWDPTKGGAGWTYPDNPHVWLGLNEMVDEIIAAKGYMVREFHAVADIDDNTWYKNKQGQTTAATNTWVINSPAAEMGGWWGGITKNQLRVHYQYVAEKIKQNKLVVYTPSEAVKYRMTANASSNPVLTQNGAEYNLSVTTTTLKNTQQQDEISVIVPISATKMNVEYTNGGNPRIPPKKLDDNTWSVNFNPFVGNVKIIPEQDFVETPWEGPEDGFPEGGGDGDECKWWEGEDCSESSISKNVAMKKNIAFTGISNGQINLRLTAGSYTASLYNLQGRVVGMQKFNAVNGVNATGLKTSNLAKGMLILKVKDAKGVSVLQNKIMIK